MDVDRISQLPEVIIHHILSFLQGKQAAKTSILSKTWLQVWLTRPILEFDEKHFGIYPNASKEKKRIAEFVEFVDSTLQRYKKDNLPILGLKLFAGSSLSLEVFTLNKVLTTALLDRWFEIALRSGVQKLEIMCPWPGFYTLHEAVFANKSLAELRVINCVELLPGHLIDTTINCHSLRRLYLHAVTVKEWMFKKIISGCPLIEELVLQHCYWMFNRIKVSNLCNLKILKFGQVHDEELEIEAPALESLTYCNLRKRPHLDLGERTNLQFLLMPRRPRGELGRFRSSQNLTCLLDSVGSSKNLKHLSLADAAITKIFFDDSMFPKLEHLEIKNMRQLKKIKLECQSFKKISLDNCPDLVKVKIISSHVIFFEYKDMSCDPESLSFRSATTQLIFYHDYLDFSWYFSLRRSLKKSSLSEVSLVILLKQMQLDVNVLSAIPAPARPKIEQLELFIMSAFPFRYAEFFDGLFWSCHPKAISVHQLGRHDHELVMFLARSMQRRPNYDCGKWTITRRENGYMHGWKEGVIHFALQL